MLSPGDIVLLEFPYTNQAGSKVRPGLVLSVSPQYQQEDVNVAYITSELDSYIYDPSSISITADDLAPGTLKHESVVRVDKYMTPVFTLTQSFQLCEQPKKLLSFLWS